MVHSVHSAEPLDNNSSVSIGSIACVQIGNFSTAQGVLVWEKGDRACIRAFSGQFIGKRIQAYSDRASPHVP